MRIGPPIVRKSGSVPVLGSSRSLDGRYDSLSESRPLANTYQASPCQEINLPLNEKDVPFALPYS